tara:strand:- start:2033 stop:2443 length:411 start_codon:yes stop_codon:yes gene_type:complete
MPNATLCTVFSFTLPDEPGVLLNFANRLRTADITLQSLNAREQGDGTSMARCIPERASQFRDFAKSAELNESEETVIHVIEDDRGGDFIRVLERIAILNANINAIDAVSLHGTTGWIISTDKSHVDSLLMQINDAT